MSRDDLLRAEREEVLTLNSIMITPYPRTGCADAAWVSVALGAADLTQ